MSRFAPAEKVGYVTIVTDYGRNVRMEEFVIIILVGCVGRGD